MANEALNQLRKELDYSAMQLVRQAVDIAVEEATNQPERQFAEHQARLAKAKADKAELESEKLRRMSSLFYNPESGEFLDGEGNVVSVPSEQFAIHQARSEKARADLLELQVAERRGELVKALPLKAFPYQQAIIDAATAAPGIAQALHADRIARLRSHEEAGRILGLATDAQDQVRRIREAEERGFRRAKHVALEAVERRWRSVRSHSSPSYDDAMCAAVHEIKGIALPKMEG